MNTPNPPLRLLGIALIALASTHGLAQCDDFLDVIHMHSAESEAVAEGESST